VMTQVRHSVWTGCIIWRSQGSGFKELECRCWWQQQLSQMKTRLLLAPSAIAQEVEEPLHDGNAQSVEEALVDKSVPIPTILLLPQIICWPRLRHGRFHRIVISDGEHSD
jgi:hypothetical protein